jgi:hypothetical protein
VNGGTMLPYKQLLIRSSIFFSNCYEFLQFTNFVIMMHHWGVRGLDHCFNILYLKLLWWETWRLYSIMLVSVAFSPLELLLFFLLDLPISRGKRSRSDWRLISYPLIATILWLLEYSYSDSHSWSTLLIIWLSIIG